MRSRHDWKAKDPEEAKGQKSGEGNIGRTPQTLLRVTWFVYSEQEYSLSTVKIGLIVKKKKKKKQKQPEQ